MEYGKNSINEQKTGISENGVKLMHTKVKTAVAKTGASPASSMSVSDTAATASAAATPVADSGVQSAIRTKNKSGIHRIAFIGMFSAIAAVLMFFEFPIPFLAPAFYKFDFSEVPVLIGTFALGPVAGIMIELIKVLVYALIHGTMSAGIGELANVAIGCALILPAGFIYRRHKTKKEAVIGMAVGTLCMTVAGSLFNAYVLLPMYAAAFGGMDTIIAAGTAVNGSINSVLGFVAICVAPFNLVKGILTSLITFILYKRISNLIKRADA